MVGGVQVCDGRGAGVVGVVVLVYGGRGAGVVGVVVLVYGGRGEGVQWEDTSVC